MGRLWLGRRGVLRLPPAHQTGPRPGRRLGGLRGTSPSQFSKVSTQMADSTPRPPGLVRAGVRHPLFVQESSARREGPPVRSVQCTPLSTSTHPTP